MLVRTRFAFMQSHLLLVALGASVVLSMAATFAAASKLSPSEAADRQYRPVQSISYHLGSKHVTGTFSRENGSCRVTMMVAEAVDPEVAAPTSAARLRLSLQPGQAAGLDSEEGGSIDMTCGEAAETLVVRRGSWTDSDLAKNSQAAQ